MSAGKCSNCNSRNTYAGLSLYQCLDCASYTDFSGNPAAPGPDANTRSILESKAAPRTITTVGNFADLQRSGFSENEAIAPKKGAGKEINKEIKKD